jgi:hypothetical protein
MDIDFFPDIKSLKEPPSAHFASAVDVMGSIPRKKLIALS